MTGPEHFRAGQERMRASDYQRAGDDGDLTAAMHEAAMAQAHFLAALVAAFAQAHLPEYVSWQEVISQ